MRHPVRLAVQEQYLRGDTMTARWEHAQRLGFDAIELRGAGDSRFAARLPELQQAAAAGVPMPTVCVEMTHFVGDFDPDRRADALAQLKSQLSVIARSSTVLGRRRLGEFSRRCSRSSRRGNAGPGCDRGFGPAKNAETEGGTIAWSR